MQQKFVCVCVCVAGGGGGGGGGGLYLVALGYLSVVKSPTKKLTHIPFYKIYTFSCQKRFRVVRSTIFGSI